MSLDRFRSASATHAGAIRTVNQDAFVDRPDIGLWAVADGAGGHADGAQAAALVARGLNGIVQGLSAGGMVAEIRALLATAHASLRVASGDAVSATTVVVLVARAGRYACLWAGDSRGYLLRDGRLSQITRDHSLVQELLDAGAITAAQAAQHPQGNVITRAIGAPDETLELDRVSSIFVPGDRFLLCSDGLCKILDDAEIATLLAIAPTTAAPQGLIDAALARRARDNVTAVVVEILPPE